MKLFIKIKFIFLLIYLPIISRAQLPCISDNTGTQGKSNAQIELYYGMGFHNEHRCIENSTEILPVFTYGLRDKVDVVVAYPFLFSKIQNDTSVTNIRGFSDAGVEFKYCFFEKDILSLAIKPGISIPTGKYQLGMGSGKVSGSAFFIASLNLSALFINGNLGYMRNSNKCGDALDIWHLSLDADYSIKEDFHLIANTGIEKNPDKSEKLYPVFGLIGVYYCLGENFEISTGYKKGLTSAETNHAFIYGLTFRF